MKVKINFSKGPISKSVVEENEGSCGISFPLLYKRLVLSHDRPSLSNDTLTFYNICLDEELTTLVTYFFSQQTKISGSILEETQCLTEEHEQPGLVPFASEAFGDMICFDYRGANRHSDDPPVVYWNHEFGPEEGRNPCPLAPNFLAFMEMLQPNPDEPPSDDAVEVEI